jgi:thioredoxin reductase
VTGLAAAMYAGRLTLRTIVLGHAGERSAALDIGGTITLTDVVENYPGFVKESMEMLGVHHARSCSHCKAHDVDNLYVVDASFFPSSGAVNPALTVMANALRVGHHILERLA